MRLVMAGSDTSAHPRLVRHPGTTARSMLDQPFDGDDLQRLRRDVAGHAEHLGVPVSRVENLLLVTSELATNAVRHGGGHGRLRLWARGPFVYVQVSDGGPGLADPHAGSEPPDPLATDGRGLWICRQVCSQLIIACQGQGRPGTSIIAVLTIARRTADGTAGHRDRWSPHVITRPT